MTFSIAAACPRSGQLGIAISSSSPAVASRCAWASTGAGVVATQNITDPRLGQIGLELLARGLDAERVCAMLVQASAHPDYRQLAVLDAEGRTAGFSGARTLGVNAREQGAGCIASGNLLDNTDVPAAMTDRFAQDPGGPLAERLLRALEAGLEAGGEADDVRSAGLLVAATQSWPYVDLRIDWHDEPIGALRAAWDVYAPQAEDYVKRALDPAGAPTYGVEGDP